MTRLVPDIELLSLVDFGPDPFDRPVPPDLMRDLDLDEIASAIDRLEADPQALAGHEARLAVLASRLAALAGRSA